MTLCSATAAACNVNTHVHEHTIVHPLAEKHVKVRTVVYLKSGYAASLNMAIFVFVSVQLFLCVCVSEMFIHMLVFVCLSGCVRLSADRCVSPHHSSCQRRRRGRRRWDADKGHRLPDALPELSFLCAHSLEGVLQKSYVGQRQPAATPPSITTVCNTPNEKKNPPPSDLSHRSSPAYRE